jgi:uncharacterized protein (DUF2141 family)
MKSLAALSLLILALSSPCPPAQAETLVVKLSGLGGRAGVVRVMVWREAAGFPTKPEKAVAQKAQPVTGPEGELSFSGLARGSYAVAGYVDENSNGVMDRSLLGWPVEPTAASNGARGVVGPPSFADAAFELKQPVQAIELKFK